MAFVLPPRIRFAWWLAAACCAPAALAGPEPAAVTAQDKATARGAATRGIELYRAGQFAEALELLGRAQALYDAPPHLLYIARSERALGRWVEAAETYRLLARRPLEPRVPEAFTRAVRDGAGELAELKPQIPRLLLHLEPKEARVSPLLELDGQLLPVEAVDLERPTNPGERELRVSAPGFEPAERRVVLVAGEVTEVSLMLVPSGRGESQAAPPPPAPVAEPAASESNVAARPPAEPAPRPYLVATLRLGLALPGGKLPAAVASPIESSDVRFTKLATAGAEAELSLGFSLPIHWWTLRRVGGALFLQVDGFGAQQSYEPFAAFDKNLTDVTGAALGSFGALVQVGASREVLGAFGELGIIASRRLTFAHWQNGACGEDRAQLDTEATGLGLRLGGGVNIPMSRWFRLQPYGSLNVGSADEVTYSPNACLRERGFGPTELDEQLREPVTRSVGGGAGYVVFSLGLGGEFGWGL